MVANARQTKHDVSTRLVAATVNVTTIDNLDSCHFELASALIISIVFSPSSLPLHFFRPFWFHSILEYMTSPTVRQLVTNQLRQIKIAMLATKMESHRFSPRNILIKSDSFFLPSGKFVFFLLSPFFYILVGLGSASDTESVWQYIYYFFVSVLRLTRVANHNFFSPEPRAA